MQENIFYLFTKAYIQLTLLLLWAKSNQKPFRAAMPASGETFAAFRVSSGFCPLLSWSPRLALLGLAERPARFSFSGQAMMEIARLLHAAFINGLSGPILFPRPSPKHCLIARTKTLGGRKAAPPGPPVEY
jgi:hypothetical protein